jgi:hypothetical protein
LHLSEAVLRMCFVHDRSYSMATLSALRLRASCLRQSSQLVAPRGRYGLMATTLPSFIT